MTLKLRYKNCKLIPNIVDPRRIHCWVSVNECKKTGIKKGKLNTDCFEATK